MERESGEADLALRTLPHVPPLSALLTEDVPLPILPDLPRKDNGYKLQNFVMSHPLPSPDSSPSRLETLQEAGQLFLLDVAGFLLTLHLSFHG